MGQRSFAVSPDGGASPSAQRARLRSAAIARSWPRHRSVNAGPMTGAACTVRSWAGDSIVALRSGARTPTQIVLYDATTWPAPCWPSARSRLGPVDLPEPELVEVEHDGVVAPRSPLRRRRRPHAVLDPRRPHRPVAGRVHATRRVLVVAGAGTCSCPIRAGRPATDARTSRRCAANGGGSTSTTRRRSLRPRTIAAGARRRRTVMIGGSSGGLTALGVLGLHPRSGGGGVVLYPVTDLADAGRAPAIASRRTTPTASSVRSSDPRALPRAVADHLRRPHRACRCS